jgi:site-specific DNA recombinase
MKYLVYCRKSTDREDRQILSTDAQKRLLLEHAERQRLTVVDLYVENQSAYKAGRPKFNEMLARLEKGEADGILSYHLTRLARNSYDGGRIIYMMDEGTIVQISTPEKAYLNNADDKFMMQIHFAMAKKSSDDTSQFVRRDVESKLLKGEFPGRVPLGYLNINRDGHIARSQDDDEKHQMLRSLGRPLRREEIDPIEGPLVRRLFEEAAKGTLGFPHLRKFAHRMGLRTRGTGKPLGKNAVELLLTNPYFYGAIRHNGMLYDSAYLRARTGDPSARIQHDPLITKTLFDEVQEALYGRRKGRYRKHRFAFGGCILRCDECGGPVTAERQKGHVYYHCTGNGGPCTQRHWMREEVLEERFAEILGRLRIDPEFLDYSFERLRQAHGDESRAQEAMRRKLQGLLNDAQQKLDGLLQLKISPGNRNGLLLSDEEYLLQKSRILRDIEMTKEELLAVQQQSETWVDDCERFFAFTQRLERTFAVLTVEEKKEVILLICSNLTLRDGILAVVYREPYASLASLSSIADEPISEFEPLGSLPEAEKSKTYGKWLRLLDRIRTYTVPDSIYQMSLRHAENSADSFHRVA